MKTHNKKYLNGENPLPKIPLKRKSCYEAKGMLSKKSQIFGMACLPIKKTHKISLINDFDILLIQRKFGSKRKISCEIK